MPKLHVNNIGVHYEIMGQGEPLLFIHGLASSSCSWKKQTPLFSQHYQVITFDIRGHGRSDKPLGPYSIELFATDAVALMRALGLGPAHIVGFSMGGMVAFQMAVDVPEMVRSLVAVNCCPEGSIRTFNNGVVCFKHIVSRQFKGIRHKRESGDVALKSAFDGENQHQSVIQRMAVNNKLAYANAFGALLKWSVADHLADINCPTLMIAADGDYVPVSVKESYVSKMPDAELSVINNSWHATPREQTEQFNAILLEFLSRHSARLPAVR
jgi:3-oxoadipate enol-lactonase